MQESIRRHEDNHSCRDQTSKVEQGLTKVCQLKAYQLYALQPWLMNTYESLVVPTLKLELHVDALRTLLDDKGLQAIRWNDMSAGERRQSLRWHRRVQLGRDVGDLFTGHR